MRPGSGGVARKPLVVLKLAAEDEVANTQELSPPDVRTSQEEKPYARKQRKQGGGPKNNLKGIEDVLVISI